MSSLDKLCFILVERQKANSLRRKHLSQYYTAEKNLKKHLSSRKQRLKKQETKKHMNAMRDSFTSYRRVADLMNDQRPLLRELRKNIGAKIKYTANNACLSIVVDKKTFDWSDITRFHNSYVFESTVLKDETKIHNPYAKELYAKETKQEENN